jgi:hypothetical protein
MTRARLCLLALLLFVAGPAFAQTNIAGDWDLTIESPQGARTVPVSLKQEGEKITGVFKSPGGELPISGTLTGNDLKLSFTVSMQGNALEIAMTGKVTGESFAGTADFGGFAEGAFSGKRPAATATTTAPSTTTEPTPAAPPAATTTVPGGLSGAWEVVLKTGGGDFPATATITEDGGKITGTFSTQMGDLPVTGTVEGKAVKLSMVAKTPQGDIPVALTGDLDGDSVVNGKADFGGMGQGEWTAKRKQ